MRKAHKKKAKPMPVISARELFNVPTSEDDVEVSNYRQVKVCVNFYKKVLTENGFNDPKSRRYLKRFGGKQTFFATNEYNVGKNGI